MTYIPYVITSGPYNGIDVIAIMNRWHGHKRLTINMATRIETYN
jgi:hypothetical protein